MKTIHACLLRLGSEPVDFVGQLDESSHRYWASLPCVGNVCFGVGVTRTEQYVIVADEFLDNVQGFKLGFEEAVRMMAKELSWGRSEQE